MKDQLISFQTAKLAKEKGFKESCFHYFSLEGEEKSFKEDMMYFYSKGENGRVILRPTQSLLQKWLREVHNIDITVALVGPAYGFYIHKNKAYTNKGENYGVSGHTYEEALEAALIQGLILLP